MNGGPTTPEDAPRGEGLPPAIMAYAQTVHYVSTACVHGRHDDCRWTCKWCSGTCQCECHHDKEPPPADEDHYYDLEIIGPTGSVAHEGHRLDEALALVRFNLQRGYDVSIGRADPTTRGTPGVRPPGI